MLDDIDIQQQNFVADGQNWEGRVKSELEASKQWYKDWGSLYAPQEPASYEDRLARLREMAEKIPGARMETNNASYGTGKPFKEFEIKKPR